MTSISDSQSGAYYNNSLDTDTPGKKERKRWNIYFLILSLILGTETFITSCLLYDFASDILAIRDSLTQDADPLNCLHQLANPVHQGLLESRGLASCDMLNQEVQSSISKRLLLDIHKSLWRTLGEHNITQSFKPAIHVGAKQGLKQYHHLQKTGDSQDATRALEQINWDGANGQANQKGMMRLSADGEIEVPQTGIYFVYSQVLFESKPGLALQFLQYLFKKTELYPQPLLLSKAAASACVNSQCALELYSSQQGALFHLERGDRLSLYVVHTSAVHFLPESTYFGAFMIN